MLAFAVVIVGVDVSAKIVTDAGKLAGRTHVINFAIVSNFGNLTMQLGKRHDIA